MKAEISPSFISVSETLFHQVSKGGQAVWKGSRSPHSRDARVVERHLRLRRLIIPILRFLYFLPLKPINSKSWGAVVPV